MPDIDKKTLATLLPNCKVVLDIGSYNGKDAHELSYVLDCDVHCFEPDTASFEKIKGLQNDRLILWPYAITAWHGKAPFVKSKNHPASNSMRVPWRHIDVFPAIKFSRGSFMVKCTTLDAWHRNVLKGVGIDLIWLDVNGSEGDVIKGGTQALKVTKYLYIEFQEVELFKGAMNREKTLLRMPEFELISEWNFEGNYGNLLLKNKNEELWHTKIKTVE